MTLSNYLTFIRIFISPVFLLLYVAHDFFGISSTALPYFLLVLMSVSEASDFFDGYLARKYDQVTDFGKIFDPAADSIVRLTQFMAFTEGPVGLPIVFVFVLFYRDMVISSLRTVCALRGQALAARPSGKLKAVIQAVSAFIIVLAMIPHSLGYMSLETLQLIAKVVVGFAGVYTLATGVDYLYANRDYIRKLLAQGKA